MRIASIVIAFLVVVFIYFFVFERESLLQFAGNDTAAAEMVEEPIDATPPPPARAPNRRWLRSSSVIPRPASSTAL